MRNYTLTPIYKNGKWINTWKSWSKQFLLPLANDVKSLYDYWLYFSPNYEEVPYFNIINSDEEIIKYGLKNISDTQESNIINNKKLWIHALNYRQYVYIRENGIKAAFGNDIDLPAGAAIISNVMPIGINNSDNDERKNINNYIIQYSSSADYYLYSIERDDENQYKLIATYTPKAGEIYGHQITLQIPSYFSRFYVNTNQDKYKWKSEESGKTFAAFSKDSTTQIITNQIQDKEKLVWQNFLELLSRTYLTNSNIDGEEIILDATYTSFLNKIDNMAIPSYTINIINNEKQVNFEGINVLLY